MSDWRPDFDPVHLYFVTTTAVQRAHIFQRDVIKRILVDGLYPSSMPLVRSMYLTSSMFALAACFKVSSTFRSMIPSASWTA